MADYAERTELDLRPIKARWENPTWRAVYGSSYRYHQDVDDLIAEVERLRIEVVRRKYEAYEQAHKDACGSKECVLRPGNNHPAYEQGYTDGGHNNAADWNAALDEILPEHLDPESPSAVAGYISRIQAAYLTVMQTEGRRCGVCIGASPSWDGHDRNPPCHGRAMEMLEEAIVGKEPK